MRKSLVYLICFFGSLSSICQQIRGFEKVDFGYLCDYSVAYEIAQDTFGSMWVATEEGLLRHNSREAFLYNEYSGLPQTFSSKIQNVFVDSNNGIWSTSDNRLGIFNPVKNVFEEIKPNKNNLNYIYDINEWQGKLWVATFNGLWATDLSVKPYVLNLIAFKDESIHFINSTQGQLILGSDKGSFSLDKPGSTPQLIDNSNEITAVTEAGESYLVGTKSGLVMLLDKDYTLLRSIMSKKSPISKIIGSDSGEFFVASDGEGIFYLDREYNIVDQYTHNANLEYTLPNDGVYDLFIGKKNQLWVASYGGGVVKSKIEEQGFTNISHSPFSDQGLNNNFTRSICKTQEGEIWYGTKEGISIEKPNGQWEQVKSLSRDDSEKVIVMDLYESGDYVWAATYGNGAFKINKKSLSSENYSSQSEGRYKLPIDKIYSITGDKEDHIWFGGLGGPLSSLSKENMVQTYAAGQIRDMVLSPSGQLFLAGRQGVQYMEDGKLIVINELSNNESFNYSTVNCISFINDNEFWIGTSGDGLAKFNLRDKKIDKLNMSDGLPSDVIQGIIQIKDDLWVSTSRGLVLLEDDGGDYRLRIFDERDGLLNASFNYGSFEAIDNQVLAFGTASGVIKVDRLKIPKVEDRNIVIFENIEVLDSKNGNNVNRINIYGYDPQEIKLSHWQNFIKVRFASIDHLTPEKQNFTWMMNGVSDLWSPSQSENEINFANLSPGRYELKIATVNATNGRSTPQVLSFVIESPWYATKLAYLFYSLFLIGAAIIGYKIAKTLVKKRNSDEQISFYNNITHELKTPLSILLNKLDNTTSDSTNNEEIKSTVHRLNSLFDQLLNFNKVNSQYYKDQKVSSIDIKQHFSMIITSFNSELTKKNITLNFDNEYPNQLFYYKKDVLDKITYNIISNSVKYTGNGGSISVKLKSEEGDLVATITDNGIGIPKDQQKDILKRYYRARNAINSQLPGTGLGLMIVKNLLDIDKGKISFVSEQGLGTSFTIELRNMKKAYVPTEVIESVPKILSDDKQFGVSGKYKVLIVEDNDELRIDMVEKLSEHFSIIAARDGKEGYEKASTRVPNLIVTDLIMPEMDGNALCKALQEDENTNHIPIFMMTVLNDSSQKVESIKSGINTYMTKPLDFPFLIAKINSVLEYKQKLRDKYLHETEIEKSTKFKDEREEEFINDLEAFIIERIKDEDIAVKDLCQHVGMSRTSLYMKLTEMINQSPQNFIITTKMNHARNLLLQGGKTVQEIAFIVGFNNPKYFSTSFKKQFGMSPSGFLKSLNPQS